jgi:hypothetical protein
MGVTNSLMFVLEKDGAIYRQGFEKILNSFELAFKK